MIFNQIETFIFNPSTKVRYRLGEKNFTRNRKLFFDVLILFLLNMPKRTLAFELHTFFTFLKERTNKIISVSTSAFTQSRKKLSPDVFVGINKVLLQEYYTDNDERLKYWKGHRLLAIDGSRATLPQTEELKSEYGVCNNQNKTDDVVQARISVLYDVLNELVLDGILSSLRTGEITLAHEHIKLIKEKDIVILDRGYPSFQLAFEILENKADFLFRCKYDFNNLTKQFMASDKQEAIVEIAPGKNKVFKNPDLTKDSRINVRLIKVSLESGETELLMTSLIDQDVYPYTEFKKLYFTRWKVETFYNRIKNILIVENFSGITKHAILQDFYCALFITNVQSLIIEEAQSKVDEKTSGRKYNYKVNSSIPLGLMKYKILDLFTNKGAQITLVELEKLLVQHTIPIREGRRYKRGVGKYRKRKTPPMFKNRKRNI